MGRKKTISDQELLRQARALFLSDGVAASTKDIAERAGLSEAALFQRFHTKRALLIAALAPGKLDAEAVLRPAEAPSDIPAALEFFGLRMLAYFREQIPCGLLLMTSGVKPQEFLGDGEGPLVAFTQTLTRFLGAANARGGLTSEDPLAAAGLYVAAVHSLVIFELGGGHGESHSEHAIKSFSTALWRGLEPRR